MNKNSNKGKFEIQHLWLRLRIDNCALANLSNNETFIPRFSTVLPDSLTCSKTWIVLGKCWAQERAGKLWWVKWHKGHKMSEQGQDYSMKDPLEEKEVQNSEKSDDGIFHPSMQTNFLTEFLWRQNDKCVLEHLKWKRFQIKKSSVLWGPHVDQWRCISEHHWSNTFRLFEEQYMAWSKGQIEAYLHITLAYAKQYTATIEVPWQTSKVGRGTRLLSLLTLPIREMF